ncbi:hypothetical protein B0H19DRAFT_927963 [Mycena capillaripes]|nr:hypothetical protein B0H19DRAFT_927963 [Mycena capillaripes]
MQGELSHRLVKRFYARSNKRNVGPQIAGREQKQRVLRKTNQRMRDAASAAAVAQTTAEPDRPADSDPTSPPIQKSTNQTLWPEDEDLPLTPPRVHHHISESKRNFLNVFEFNDLSKISGDPANFLLKLRTHLLSRLLGLPYDGDEAQFSQQDLMDVTFVHDRIYSHKVMKVNFTTYDVRRDVDSINPRTHSDIMLLSHEDDDEPNPHPYWYARVIGIFHAEIRHVGMRSKDRRTQRMEFLWVRWYGRDLTHKAGWKAKRLHRLGFIDSTDDGAFGFLDPAEVLRGAHIIPAFHHGLTSDLLPKSIARRAEENDEDYVYYYINP